MPDQPRRRPSRRVAPGAAPALVGSVAVAAVVVISIVALAVLGPVLAAAPAPGPTDGDRSSAIVATTTEPAVVAAPEPRSPGPVLLPLVLAILVAVLAGARSTAPAGRVPRSAVRAVGIDRWRALLVGAPPIPVFSASH